MNPSKTPSVRFKGYEDEWEERKLGEVFNQTVEYINPNEANLELWSVTVERGLTPKTARYNREALVKKNDKFKVVHDGDIVYNPMNLTIGAVGFNKSEKSVAVSGYYVTMNMNSGFNNSYFQTWLKSENAIKQYKLYATGSLIEKQRVQFPTLSLIKSYIPTFEEQQKIGSFFKQLDNSIALHQRKLDLLKEQKKGYLQKMFPKNGAKVPELRFAGFTDAWEERKSKDLFTPINERNREDLPVLSVTQDQGVVLRNDLAIDIKYDKSTLSSYKVIHPGDFVISLRSFQGGFELSKVLGISSPAYTIFDLKNLTAHNKLYWKYIFKSFKFIESLKTVTFGIRDGKSISFREFSDLKINYPSDASEQEKIGSFFQQLDETIDLHQRKIDELKLMKKSMLQKMFV